MGRWLSFRERYWSPTKSAVDNRQCALGGGKWAVVAVERTGEQSKRITVSGNPFGALKLQPALGSKRLTKAEPAGSTTESSGDVGRVDWLFVGAAARDATVTVEWA